MARSPFARSLRSTFLLLGLAESAHAQWFLDNVTDIPQGAPHNASRTENVDFGDVDLDGDWDAIFADGGDLDQDQNRIWTNLGPGANLGRFVDETATRCPAVNDQSRDVEFVDFDGDADLDVYVSNTSSIVPQSNRWWRNTGVGSGVYVDETATRFVGLGGPGSSIAPSQVLGSGGFIDYSCDSDFGDLDGDGDLDLVHSSYGSIFQGNIPTRIFLNDGAGFFSEFNPSGFQLPGSTISNGMPGLWCEGTQQHDTTNSTGLLCDVASSAVDIDVGDIDGDFDLDILHGARQELPRMFENRLEENGGTLGFRDVTGSAFPPGYSTGDGHYEQEMGDFDGDGDLDIYGLNWLVTSFNFNDCTLRNDGSGTYSDLRVLPNSAADDSEADFLDYDNDGDLDAFVANFSGRDRLYRNEGPGGPNPWTFSDVTTPGTPNLSLTALDGDACDVDGDGDYDVFVSNNFNVRNQYLENTLDVPDVHAPYLPRIEQLADRDASAAPTGVRVHVYDNAPYYVTWYNDTVLRYTIDGGPPAHVPMRSTGGQVFRGEIPGAWVGTICYRAISSDEYGNTQASIERCFDAAPSTGIPYCFGDGSGTPCPCSNPGASGRGCANGTFATGALLSGFGTPSVGADTLVLVCTGATPLQPGLFFQGDGAPGGGAGIVFGDGLRCAGSNARRLQVRVANAAGAMSTSVSISTAGAVSPGDEKRYQCWYRDPVLSPCGQLFNTTNGLRVPWN